MSEILCNKLNFELKIQSTFDAGLMDNPDAEI